MEELKEICSIVQEEAHEEAIIKWGLVWDEALGDEIRVTVIATGIGKRAELERPAWTPAGQPPQRTWRFPPSCGLRRRPGTPRSRRQPGNSRTAANLGVVGAKKNIVHPDLQYEESELDIPPFLRKADQ